MFIFKLKTKLRFQCVLVLNLKTNLRFSEFIFKLKTKLRFSAFIFKLKTKLRFLVRFSFKLKTKLRFNTKTLSIIHTMSLSCQMLLRSNIYVVVPGANNLTNKFNMSFFIFNYMYTLK